MVKENALYLAVKNKVYHRQLLHFTRKRVHFFNKHPGIWTVVIVYFDPGRTSMWTFKFPRREQRNKSDSLIKLAC